MAILTGKPSVIAVGATSGTITLSPSTIVSQFGITDPYWSVTTNWQYAIFTYNSPIGGESYNMLFNILTDTSVFKTSSTARIGNWTVSNITIFDFDNGSYIIPRSSFTPSTAEFDIAVGFAHTFGWMAAGSTTTSSANVITAITQLDFGAETTSVLSSTWNAVYQTAGASSNLFGYGLGGANSAGNPVTTIKRLDFTALTTSTLSATLTTAVRVMGAGQSTLKGYVMGGKTSTVATNAIQALTFSNETEATLSATLGSIINFNMVASSDLAAFSFEGDDGSVFQSAIYKLLFSTETSSTLSATMPTPNYPGSCMAASSNALAGYTLGGVTSNGAALTNIIQKLVYSGETTATVGSTLSANNNNATALNSMTNGYNMGGEINGGGLVNTIERFAFSGETVSTIAATLNTSKFSGAGLWN